MFVYQTVSLFAVLSPKYAENGDYPRRPATDSYYPLVKANENYGKTPSIS